MKITLNMCQSGAQRIKNVYPKNIKQKTNQYFNIKRSWNRKLVIFLSQTKFIK